ncbi:glycosyltransferase [Aeromonas caviae]
MYVKKISIVSLTYNNSSLLTKAINSVANQIIDEKYQIEYLVVDDGSLNFDMINISSYLNCTNLNYTIIVNTENLGIVKSLNRAIKASTGDIIIPLSADDEFYDSTVLNDIVEEFNRTQAYLMTGIRTLISDGSELAQLPNGKLHHLFARPSALLKRIMVQGNIISGASTYYHRKCFEEFGVFDEKCRLIEDYPYYIKVLSAGIGIHLFKRKVIKYGANGISSSGKNSILKKDYSVILNRILERDDLQFFEKRFIKYTRLIESKDRFLQVYKYPEQALFFLLYKLLVFIRTKSILPSL